MSEEQRRLVVILAADAAGYSRLMGRDETGTMARLRAHRKQRLEPAIARHNGRVFKLTGDGALVEFANTVDALSAAIEFQQEVNRVRVPGDEGAIVFRVGLHMGDVIVDEDNDLYGDGVNIAARLEGQAENGGILVSGAVHDAVAGRVKASFIDVGDLALKNIQRPVRGYRVTWEPADWPVPEPPPVPPRAIPPALAAASPSTARALLDKPSIAVLPFTNLGTDPEHDFLGDGVAEDIITELSRFREFAVISRNSTFTYKGRSVDAAQVGRELGAEYMLVGSVRSSGKRVRINVQLINTDGNHQAWAERYDRTLDDVLDIQDEITRTVVASISSEISHGQEASRPRRDVPTNHVRRLTAQAMDLFARAIAHGSADEMQETIDLASEAVAQDARSLTAHLVLSWAHAMRHLYRFGPDPAGELDRAWEVAQTMARIDPTDTSTLSIQGALRVMRGQVAEGLGDLRRAHASNPNATLPLMWMAFGEAVAGESEKAKEHALLAIRLSPRDPWIGVAQLALAMATFTRDEHAEATRWAELAIQTQPKAPIRRALMIACSTAAGDTERARRETETLRGFAPDFVPSLFRGENRVFARDADMDKLLQGLRRAGL